MGTKVVGFEVKIKGQKDIVTTTKLFGLLNEQLVGVGKSLDSLENDFSKASSSAKQLGDVVKTSFGAFKQGNKVVKDLGNGYLEVTKAVDKTTKEIKENEKVFESDSDTIKDVIKRNKELKKTLIEQTSATGEQSEELRELGKEYSKNNDAIKAFRKELRTGKKASEASAGSLDELRAKAISLKKQYNSLSKSQRNAFLGDGRKIQKSLAKTNKQIQKLDLSVKDGKTSIGLYRNAQKGLTKTLLKLSVGRSIADGVANGLRNIFNGLKEIATGSDEAKEQFKDLNSAGAGLQNTFQKVGQKILGAFGGGITKIIDNVSFVVSKVGDAFISASEGTGLFARALRFVGSIFTDFPAILGGISAAAVDFATTTVNVFKRMGLQLQIVFQEVNKFNPFSDESTDQINKNIASITARQKELSEQSVGVGKAYQEGYDATIKAQEEFKKNSEEEVAVEEKRLAAAKRREEQAKEAAKAEKKRIEDLKKARAELLTQIQTESLARIKIAVDLDTELRNLQIAAISDSTDRALAAEKERFEQEKLLRQANYNEVLQGVEEQEKKIVALFGASSKELIDFINESEAQLSQLRATNNTIAEQQEQAHQDRLLKIETDGAKARADADEKAFQDEIASTEAEYEELERLEGEASDALIAKQIESSKERAAATKDAVVDLVNATFSAISDIVNIAAEAENARFDAAIESRKESISRLNEDLQNATGLHKKFLEKQVEQEEKALEEETKAKEKARKEQAEAQKAISIIQAVIAAALGITNAFSLPPPASFIAAAATGVATAAQIAVIASQKFAKGGLVLGNGRINKGSNIPTQNNGDNVLATVKTGEVILNESQQAMLGGYKTFASMGVPGFANGGVLGTPISAPSVGNATTDVNEQFNKFMSASLASTAATNARIDRIGVSLDLNNLQDVEDNDATLEAMTTF